MATEKQAWLKVGRGVSYCVSGDDLIVRVPITDAALKAAQPSASGKTRVVGSTQGNVKIEGTTVVMGLNVYTKA